MGDAALFPPAAYVPDPHRLVPARRGKVLAVGGEIERFHGFIMAFRGRELASRSDFIKVNLDRRARHGQGGAVRTDGHGEDLPAVKLYALGHSLPEEEKPAGPVARHELSLPIGEESQRV